MSDAAAVRVLVVRVGGRTCALPLAHVVETMRPLPVAPMHGAPPGVVGASIIRGEATPVVDLAKLVDARPTVARRFVTVRAGARPVALAVDEVVGIVALPQAAFAGSPPLLRDVLAGAVEALATLDRELILVLRAARLSPDALPATPLP
jgi:purine-binding chemotaxis protein CheW